jgi:hypothetical protein
MDGVGIFYGHFVYFAAIWYSLLLFGILYGYLVYLVVNWYILWLFGISYGHLVYFSVFWYFVPTKIWQPGPAG